MKKINFTLILFIAVFCFGINQNISANTLKYAVTSFNDSFTVFPNPFIPNKIGNLVLFESAMVNEFGDDVNKQYGGIFFYNIPLNCDIEIYSIKGEKVYQSNNLNPILYKWRWDTRNASGELVGSGWYIYRIKSSAGQKIGKLAIVR